MLFKEVGLSAELLRAIEQQGYQSMTPIQEQAIPRVLAGHDVLAGAQTGTGKTASFALPLLQLLQTGKKNRRSIRALVITPTRELAEQVADNIRGYGQYLPFRTATIFGGINMKTQVAKLRKGVDVVVATPGRLLDHLEQGTIDLRAIECLVLDEADRMLDMGFIRDIRKIMQRLPKDRQTLLFSATFSPDIRQLAVKLLNKPVEISVAANGKPAEGIDQVVYPCEQSRKRALLSSCIRQENWHQVLVFTRTKHGANRLGKQLETDGLGVGVIHGNKSQAARKRALQAFKDGEVGVLVATDVAARGIDIERLPYVVNYELPHVPEDYVHRIGRTARAGQQGHAISLVSREEHGRLREIEELLQTRIKRETKDGYAETGGDNQRSSKKTTAKRPHNKKSQPKKRQKPANTRRRKGPAKRKRTRAAVTA